MNKEELKEFAMDVLKGDIIEWYDVAEKLHRHYTCQRCGHCCTTTVPYLSPKDVQRIVNHLKMDGFSFLRKHTTYSKGVWLKSPCPFLRRPIKNRRHASCTIYEVRPEVCRGYPFNQFGVVNSVDKCALARAVYEDLKEIEPDQVDPTVQKYMTEALQVMGLDPNMSPEGVAEITKQAYERLNKLFAKDTPEAPRSEMVQNLLTSIHFLTALLRKKEADKSA